MSDMRDTGLNLPMQAAGRRSTFFESDSLEHMMTMLLEIAAESWVLRERLYAIESVLEGHHPGISAAIERWQPDDDAKALLADRRKAMLNEIFRTLDIEKPTLNPYDRSDR